MSLVSFILIIALQAQELEMQLALSDLYRACWTEKNHSEWISLDQQEFIDLAFRGQEQVTIILRDNGYQDGDLVTLSVNERVYATNQFLTNAGVEIPVSLKPGVNLVKIYGNRDGLQNGMGISLAADVSNRGNGTTSLMPENTTAIFNIIRP